MAATYSLGVFNDNFFRQSAMMIAVTAGQKYMQGYLMAIFALPYLLFAAPAGWLADRFPKHHVVIGAKVLELGAMICGAIGICTGNWAFILAMVFTMGLQSAMFSPSLNASIPELYPPHYVPTANAILKGVVTAAILAGVACSGLALGRGSGGEVAGIPSGRLAAAIVVLCVSSLGVLLSLGVPRRRAASPHAAFPWSGPLDTVRELRKIGRDRLLGVIVAANTFAWATGALLIPVINLLALEQYRVGESVAAGMVASELIGIAIGGFIGSRLAKNRNWYRVLPPAALSMSVLMAAMGAVPALPASARLVSMFVLLGLIGVGGGVFLIPCEAFIQVRPAAEKKGAVIAAANFAVFSGVLLSGPVSNFLTSSMLPTTCFALIGGVTLLVSALLYATFRKLNDKLGRDDA